MKTAMLRLAIILVVCFGISVNANAHDPGISYTDVTVNPQSIVVHSRFAWSDIDTLVLLDTNNDEILDKKEFENTKTELERVALSLINLRSGEDFLNAKNITVDFYEPDVIGFYIDFPKTISDSIIALEEPLFEKLPRGHRQFVSTRNSDNELVEELILSANQPSALIGIPQNRSSIFAVYVIQGIWHIWIGFDHLLFLLTLLLPAVLVYENKQWKSTDSLRPTIIDIAKTVTVFTLAHSITLTLSTLNFVVLSSVWVEPAIAGTLIAASLNNVKPFIPLQRWTIAFSFGLIHGLGFAGALKELGVNAENFVMSVVGFNIGVEVGQLILVALTIPVIYAIRNTALFRIAIYKCGSIAIASMASVWLIQRVATAS